ncbi:DUF3011 domain-containing protein [Zoogloea sp.]|uniref:DUF3011 domain-containing protein n=1 Tax=Zoogloea sp. TaxID=49181 RepID=UPI0035B1AAE4
MNRWKPIVRPLVATLLCSWITPSFAGHREIECGSVHGRYNFCSTGAHGDVELQRQLSFASCDEGRSWGVERDGIWVDNGCNGRFRVEDDGHGKHGGNKTAIVAGAVGLAVLGAILLNSKKSEGDSGASGGTDGDGWSSESAGSVPAWAVGNYHGYNPRRRAEVVLALGSGGRVKAEMQGRTHYGSASGDTVTLDSGQRFRLSRTDSGLRLSDLDEQGNIIDFYRDR